MKLCKNCGERVEQEKAICPNCGNKLDQKEKILISKKVEENFFEPHQKKYNKWISLILCGFFGWLGAHKFYERKYIMGILYFFTYGFLGIGWVLDFITLLKKPNPYYLYQ